MNAPEIYDAKDVCQDFYWGKYRGPMKLVSAYYCAELEAALKRTEENRNAAMQDAQEESARADKAEALLAEAVEALEQLRQWSEAYPVEVFPEPDFNVARAALKDAGMTLDAISASNMRYVLNGVGGITRATLAKIKEAKA